MRWPLICLACSLALFGTPAWAIVNCSGTATVTSTTITLRAQAHFEIQNPATNAGNICINLTGSTATCGSAGTYVMVPGGGMWRDFPDLPVNPQIVSPSGSQPYTCDYQ